MIKCPECTKEMIDGGNRWECSTCAKVTIYKETAKYTLTEDDVNAMANGGATEIHEFTSRAGKPFRARLRWHAQEQKATFVFPEPKPSIEGVLCPDHFVELRMSDKRYYCPTKIDDDSWCPVGMWRDHAGHTITTDELEKLLLGMTVGPWTLTTRDAKSSYQVVATFDFTEHKLRTSPVDGDVSELEPVPVVEAPTESNASKPTAITQAPVAEQVDVAALFDDTADW